LYADAWTVDPLYIGLTDTPNALKVYKTGRTSDSDDYSLMNPSTGEFISRGYFGAPNYSEEPWGEWFRTNNTNWNGFVSDSGQWAENLPKLGFKGNIFDPDSEGGGGFTQEAQTAIDKLKKQGYEFLTNPNTHNNYSVAVTPLGTYKLNTRGTSFLQDIAPILGIIAMPFTGGLSAALGGGAATLGSTIAANALVQGGLGALTGQDPLQAAIRGGVTAGIGSLVNPIANSIGADVLNATDSKFLSDIVSGAVKGVPGALMSGDASNLLTGAVTGAVGSQVGNELGLTPQQSQVATNIASKLLQGGDLSLSDIVKIGTSFGGKTPTASETAVGGGAETSGFFDPDVEAGLLYYGSDPDQEKYIDEDRLLARYPAPIVEDVRTSMSPMELNKFLEENIEDPATVEQLMQDYYPELYSTTPDQTITVTGEREGVVIPDWDVLPDILPDVLTEVPDRTPGSPTDTTPQPPVLDDDRTVAPTPAPTPAPAPGPSPAPSPTPSPAPTAAQSGMDMSGLFALLGMMNQGREKPDPYQVAQINTPSPFGTIYDQQQDLLGLMERG
jgi:hypothetical protein